MYRRVCRLFPLALLLACQGKQEMGDGTGAVTLTGDSLDEFGDVASALWFEVTGETEIWLLEADGQIYDQGAGIFDSLHISTAPDTCDGLVGRMAAEGAASASLLDVLGARGAGDSTHWTDNCGEVGDFLGVLEAEEGDVEAYNTLTGAPAGEPSTLPYEGTQSWDGSILWVPTPGRPWEHWDAANCTLEPQSDDGAQSLVQQALLTVDTVEDTTVTGSVSGDVEDLGGATLGTIDASFDAVRCELTAPADFIFVAL